MNRWNLTEFTDEELRELQDAIDEGNSGRVNTLLGDETVWDGEDLHELEMEIEEELEGRII